jgi:hypothetical protein
MSHDLYVCAGEPASLWYSRLDRASHVIMEARVGHMQLLTAVYSVRQTVCYHRPAPPNLIKLAVKIKSYPFNF